MIETEICTSIEGEKLFLQSKQVNVMKPCINSITGDDIYPFKMGISSKAIIEEELNPKKAKFNEKSILDKGTCIKGQTIDGFSIRPLGAQEVIHTGAHRGRVINTRGVTYAHIEIGFRALLQKKEVKKIK